MLIVTGACERDNSREINPDSAIKTPVCDVISFHVFFCLTENLSHVNIVSGFCVLPGQTVSVRRIYKLLLLMLPGKGVTKKQPPLPDSKKAE
ncbi:hypothetical protein EA245_24875 [Escherichia coli]|nr:hypothetical protein EA245_24875 [Escherichia coli]